MKAQRSKTLLALCALALTASLALLWNAAPAQAADDKVYVVNMGCTTPAGDEHPIGWGLVLWGEEMKKRSGGRLDYNFMGAGQLGTGRKLYESVINGVIQVCDNSTGPLEVFTSKFTPLTLPYIFPSREVAYKFADGEYMKKLTAAAEEETGLKIVGWFENGLRHTTNSKRPIRTVADMKGLKMRVMESPMFIRIMESFGAIPVPIAYAELFTALQQKTVDGEENPIAVIISGKLYEAQEHLSLTGHVFDLLNISVNPDFYYGLPDDLRQIFDETLIYAIGKQREKATNMENDSIGFLKEKMKVVELGEAERAEFREAAKSVWDWLIEQYPQEKENLANIVAELAKIEAEMKN